MDEAAKGNNKTLCLVAATKRTERHYKKRNTGRLDDAQTHSGHPVRGKGLIS